MLALRIPSGPAEWWKPEGMSITSSQSHRHSRKRQKALAQSIGASVASKGLAVALSLVTVPIALQYLGTERYGLWATVTSLVAMLVFADLGIGNGMLNAIARASGRDDPAAIRRAIAAGVTAVALVSAVLLTLFLLAWSLVNWAHVFSVQTQAHGGEVALAVLVLVVIFALNMPVSIIQKLQYGMQQGRWVSVSQACAAVLSLALTLAVVRLDLGLVGMVGCFLLAALLADVIVGGIFLSRRRAIIPRRQDWNSTEFRGMFKVGLGFLALQLGVALCYASDNLILARLMGPETVAVYSVHQKLYSPVVFVAGLALAPLWPAFADAIARKDHRWVKRTLLVACLSMAAWAVVCGAALLLASDWLMAHWLKGQIKADLTLGFFLVVWGCIDLVGRAISMFLNGAGMLRQQLFNVAIFVPLCIGLKIVLVQTMGVEGVVVATVAAWLLVHVPAYWMYLYQWNRPFRKPDVADEDCI